MFLEKCKRIYIAVSVVAFPFIAVALLLCYVLAACYLLATGMK